MTSLLIALGQHVAAASSPSWRAVMGKNPKAASPLRAFLVMSLVQAAERQQPSLQGKSVQQTGPSVSLRRESPTTIAYLFFLVDMVKVPVLSVQQYLWCNGPSSASSFDLPSHSEPHHCCVQACGKARWAKRGFACCSEQGFILVHFFLSYCPLHGRGRRQDPLNLVLFLVAVLVTVSGRAEHAFASWILSHFPTNDPVFHSCTLK